jgi:uncharacterized protein
MRFFTAFSLFLFSGFCFGQSISMGTSPQGSAGYAMGAAIAKVVQEKAGLQARVQPFAGNSIAIAGINRGEIDFSVVNEIEIVEALSGAGSYQGRKQENVRMAAVLFPFTVSIYVKNDSPLKSVSDLKGKRMTWGYTAMVTLKTVVGAMLANGGLSESDIQPVLVPNVNRGAEDFIAGKADAFFHATSSPKVVEADASVGGLRALQMSDSPEAVARMKKVLPQGYVLDLKPRPNQPAFPGPTKVLAYDYTLVAGAHVKDETVRQVVKTLAENKDALVSSFIGFRSMNPAQLSKKIDAEFHPGAIRFLQESGQWPPR